MLVFYFYVLYSSINMSECESVCGYYLYIWCMRDELGEFHLIDELSQILKVWACIK